MKTETKLAIGFTAWFASIPLVGYATYALTHDSNLTPCVILAMLFTGVGCLIATTIENG